MTQFIRTPNLPQGKVKKLICGKISDELRAFIEQFNIEIIESIPNTNVDVRISTHADISLHHIGNDKILIEKSQSDLEPTLKSMGLSVYQTESNLSVGYPNDCKLNFARVGNIIIGKLDCLDETLSYLLRASNIKFINVKQGYSKCSVCVVNEKVIITDDTSIFEAVKNIDLDCLLINKGDVNLNGFDYGFIGGSCGLIDKNHLLFFGDITKHSDYERIRSFLAKHSCRFTYLKNYPLTDIGGIIQLTEEQ